MKKLLILGAVLLAGCTSTGAIDPNLAARLQQDATCVLALSAAGVAQSKMTSATDIIDSIQANSANPVVANACANLLANLTADVEAAKHKTGN